MHRVPELSRITYFYLFYFCGNILQRQRSIKVYTMTFCQRLVLAITTHYIQSHLLKLFLLSNFLSNGIDRIRTILSHCGYTFWYLLFQLGIQVCYPRFD